MQILTGVCDPVALAGVVGEDFGNKKARDEAEKARAAYYAFVKGLETATSIRELEGLVEAMDYWDTELKRQQ